MNKNITEEWAEVSNLIRSATEEGFNITLMYRVDVWEVPNWQAEFFNHTKDGERLYIPLGIGTAPSLRDALVLAFENNKIQKARIEKLNRGKANE